MKLAFTFASCLLASSTVLAQGSGTPGIERQVGVISRIDAATRELVIILDTGGERQVIALPQASVLRIAPGEKDLSKAMTISLAEIEAGDRVLVRGTAGADQVLAATTIVVMSRNDLARKQEAERAEWKRRGISGKVAAIDPEKRELIIATPAQPVPERVTIRLALNAVQKRYRHDSTKFNDALPSTFADIKIGDQVHALGEKSSTDGVFTAGQIVSGSFRTFAATVSSVDVAQRILSVKEADGDKPAVIQIRPNTILRRLTPEIAKQLAKGNPSKPESASDRQGVSGSGEAKGGDPDVQAIVERAPILSLEDLKPGDAVIVAGAVNPGPGPITAITVVSGVGPLLARSAAAQRELLGSWNLNLEPDLP